MHNCRPGPNIRSLLHEDLKQVLAEAEQRSLSIINWSRPFVIHSDASEHSVPGVLSQPDEEGKENPIAFYSIKLNKQQRNWSVVEKEAFATLLALKKFRGWMWGATKVVLCSDHNPLLYLTQAAPRSAKLMRWSLALQEYNLRWVYKRGASNVVADSLSRLCGDARDPGSADTVQRGDEGRSVPGDNSLY